jgi:hypothetical protein
VCLPWHARHRRADRCTGHVRSHEGIRPFACQWCARRFTREADQRRHERDRCHMRLRAPPGAQPEEASARPPTRGLTFTCEICRKPFLRPHHLNRHCTCLRRSPHMIDDAFGQCIRTKLEERPPVARSARSGSTPPPRRFAQETCRWTSISSAPCSPAVYSLQRLSANLGLVVELTAHVWTQDCWITLFASCIDIRDLSIRDSHTAEGDICVRKSALTTEHRCNPRPNQSRKGHRSLRSDPDPARRPDVHVVHAFAVDRRACRAGRDRELSEPLNRVARGIERDRGPRNQRSGTCAATGRLRTWRTTSRMAGVRRSRYRRSDPRAARPRPSRAAAGVSAGTLAESTAASSAASALCRAHS